MKNKQNLTGYPSIDKPWLQYYNELAINAKMPKRTIYELLVENNINYPNRVALNYFNKKITYRELIDNIDKTAIAFIRHGVKEGDIVTISMPTLPETIYMFYALSKIGAISNMVDPRTSAEGIKDYVNEAESKLMVVVDVAAPKTIGFKETTTLEEIITVSPADSLPMALNLGYKAKEFVESLKNKNKPQIDKSKFTTWKEFSKSANESGRFYYPKYTENKPVVIVHTGGTTGKPKGVVLTNDNVNCAAYQCQIAGFDFQREHNWLNIMPPFIAYGIGNGLHLPLICGMEVILIPQFDPNKFDELLIKHKPNHMVGVPSHYGSIINSKKLEKEDLSYVIAPTVGGDKMEINLEEKTNKFLKERNCDYKVVKGYGMTEVNAAVAACTSNETNDLGSVGIPFPQTIISIFDTETGKELGYNQNGEICITGPNTMLGYFKNETETNKILKKHDDGKIWVHSGDIGYMTEEGKLYIVDRIKRMIVRHDGFKLFPNIIEDVIASHPAVANCKVIGISDVEHSQGKLPKACIILKDGQLLNEMQIRDEIILLCSEKLAEYSQPVEYEFRNSFPLTPIGKIDFLALELESEEKIKTQQNNVKVKSLTINH